MIRIKSFTIIELIVVLIISSLLVILSLNFLLNLNRYFRNTFYEQTKVNEVLWFCLRLKNEITGSDYITGNSEILHIYKDNKERVYEIYPEKIIIKTTGITDTLKLKICDVTIKYQIDNVVNYVEMSILHSGRLFTLMQKKEYSSRFLFNQNRKN